MTLYTRTITQASVYQPGQIVKVLVFLFVVYRVRLISLLLMVLALLICKVWYGVVFYGKLLYGKGC